MAEHLKSKVFKPSNNGVVILDINKALEIANNKKYFNPNFDIAISSLNKIYNNSNDTLSALLNFYHIGKLQGIKQGMSYQKGLTNQNDI